MWHKILKIAATIITILIVAYLFCQFLVKVELDGGWHKLFERMAAVIRCM